MLSGVFFLPESTIRIIEGIVENFHFLKVLAELKVSGLSWTWL
jgi:hypothetical protein